MGSSKPTFPTKMGELMAALLLVVDAWSELARDSGDVQPADRVEVLGLLVRLVAHRFGGLRRVPNPDDVRPLLDRDSVGLLIRSPGRVLPGTESIEEELAAYGFDVQRTGRGNREVVVTCHQVGKTAGARVLAFPGGSRK